MMTSSRFIFECENPECGLRFPGSVDQLRWNKCPLCRSTIRIAEQLRDVPDAGNQSESHRTLPLELLLDNLRSALNVGSIFRTSEGIGIRKIYCCGITPTPENPKVQKTALGSESHVAWESDRNGLSTAERIKDLKRPLWVLESTPDAEPLFQVKLPRTRSNVVLVVGNEVSGVDPGIIKICDKVISIPMFGEKKSYNVAIAFSIAASFLLYRNRDRLID